MGNWKEQIGRRCPHCGAMITYDEYFCRACHTRLTDQFNLDAPGTTRPETYIVAGRKLWLSFLLSCGFPGLGQLYNGDNLKGVGFGLVYLIVSFGSFGGQYYSMLLLVILVAAITEGLISAIRINAYTRHFKGTSFLLWIGLAGLALIVLMHVYTGLPDMQYLEKIFPVAYFFPATQVS